MRYSTSGNAFIILLRAGIAVAVLAVTPMELPLCPRVASCWILVTPVPLGPLRAARPRPST